MKILAIERKRSGALGDSAPYLKAEANRAWELHQADVIRELYFRADCSNAVLILECPSLEEAEVALATLPLVKGGMIEWEMIPVRPYPGFARLFT